MAQPVQTGDDPLRRRAPCQNLLAKHSSITSEAKRDSGLNGSCSIITVRSCIDLRQCLRPGGDLSYISIRLTIRSLLILFWAKPLFDRCTSILQGDAHDITQVHFELIAVQQLLCSVEAGLQSARDPYRYLHLRFCSALMNETGEHLILGARPPQSFTADHRNLIINQVSRTPLSGKRQFTDLKQH